MAIIKITKRTVDSLPAPSRGQALYLDEDLKGFGIRVGQKSKTYFAQRDIHGKTVRVTIGRHGVLTPEMARRHARTLLAEMGAGKNPNQARKAERAKGITLGEAYSQYLVTRNELRASTRRDYDQVINKYLSDWNRSEPSTISPRPATMICPRIRSLAFPSLDLGTAKNEGAG